MGRNSVYPNKAGIYKLTCVDNGKVYIGKSVNIRRRMIAHKYSATRPNKYGHFVNAITKHGWESFKFEVVEIFENFDKIQDNSSLLERESYYIKLFDSTNRNKGYNICEYSNDRTGIPVSEETRKKIGLGNLGKTVSDEVKQRIRAARLGQPLSPESIKKRSQARIGKQTKKHSEEANKRKSERQAGKTRPPFSEEWRNNMSKAKKGIPRPQTKESIDKMKQTKLRKKLERELNKIIS
jgi:group I intron endonuclease